MNKRLINMLALLVVPVLLVAMFATFTTSGAATRTASVANTQAFAPDGTWSDLPNFPSMQLNFGSGACQGISGTTPLTLKRSSAVAYPPNGKVYLFGGRHRADGDDITSQWIWEYSPGAGNYVQKTSLLDSCQYGSRFEANMASGVLTDATGVHIYLVGGSSINSIASNAVRIYDPLTDTISNSTDVWPAAPARLPGGYAVYNNKLYIFGGYELKPTSTMYSDTWVFDPLGAPGSKWTQISGANLSVARTSIGGATLDGWIYAIGGNTVSGVVTTTTTPQTIVERMNPSLPNPTWSTVASLPTARGDMGVWAYDTGSPYEIAGKIMVGGGTFPMPDSNTYIYDPGANTWTAGVPMSRARRNFGYTQLNGMLYAFGGYNVTSTYNGSNDSMVYDGSTGGPTPTNTTTPPTATPTGTLTSTPTATRTNTAIPTGTNTTVPSATPTRTVTATGTNPPTNTPTRTNTPVPPTSTTAATNTTVPTGTTVPPTNTATETATETAIPPTAIPTPGACVVAFSDVPKGSTFYDWIHCLACGGILGGYDDGTFRPQNLITRGQIAKIVSNAAGFDDGITEGTSTFEDVVPNSTFWIYVERLAMYDVMGGYECGGPGEPCIAPDNKPYFRPQANATRGQIAKIVSNSAGFSDEIQAGTQSFEDVTEGSTFYVYVERLLLNRPGAMNGYPCGGPGEPCGTGNKPYFRPSANATRGQTAKIVSSIFFPDCVQPVYVKIQDFAFHAPSVSVAPGTTVRFVNRDPAGHTATALDDTWDTGLLFQNQYADVVFNSSSDYDCDPHPFMLGQIIVGPSKR